MKTFEQSRKEAEELFKRMHSESGIALFSEEEYEKPKKSKRKNNRGGSLSWNAPIHSI